MRNPKIVRRWAMLSLFILVFSAVAMAERQKRIAVLDFNVDVSPEGQTTSGPTKNIGKDIADLLVTRLSQLETYSVVERQQLRKILEEKKLAARGIMDEETAARVGGVLGAEALVIGNVKSFSVVNKQAGLLNKLSDKLSSRLPIPTASLKPGKSIATVEVLFKLVNAHNGTVHWAGEATGKVERGISKPEVETLLYGKESMTSPQFTRTILGEAVQDAVNKMAAQIQERVASIPEAPVARAKGGVSRGGSKYSPKSKIPAGRVNRAGNSVEPTSAAFEGSVLQITGAQVTVEIKRRGSVKNGDVLKVRRIESVKNPGGKQIATKNIIGELEVTDVQDEVIVGRYRAALKAKSPKVSDLVTSN